MPPDSKRLANRLGDVRNIYGAKPAGIVEETHLLNCDAGDPMTEIIVNKIVALATAGDHDPERLAEKVLDDLADEAA